MSTQLQYVEDYLLFIGGHYPPSTWPIVSNNTNFNLARQDVSVIDSFCNQISRNIGLTEKQRRLAAHLVDKYQRQIKLQGLDIPETLAWKLPIRVIDAAKAIYLDGDCIIAKFPFDHNLIDQFKRQSKISQGSMNFAYNEKHWRCGITEYLVNWLVTIGKQHGFNIDPILQDYFDKILATEANEMKIMLRRTTDGIDIVNAPDPLREYVIQRYGAIDEANLINLVDAASVLGFKVSDTLRDEVKKQIGYPSISKMLFNRRIKQQIEMDEIMAYAKLVNRLPVYVYDTKLDKQNTDEIIYLNHTIPSDQQIKLLVTNSPLMMSKRKQAWMHNAEKVIIIGTQ